MHQYWETAVSSYRPSKYHRRTGHGLCFFRHHQMLHRVNKQGSPKKRLTSQTDPEQNAKSSKDLSLKNNFVS